MSFAKEAKNVLTGVAKGIASGQGAIQGALAETLGESNPVSSLLRGSRNLPDLALPPYASSSPSFEHHNQMKRQRLSDSYGYDV